MGGESCCDLRRGRSRAHAARARGQAKGAARRAAHGSGELLHDRWARGHVLEHGAHDDALLPDSQPHNLRATLARRQVDASASGGARDGRSHGSQHAEPQRGGWWGAQLVLNDSWVAWPPRDAGGAVPERYKLLTFSATTGDPRRDDASDSDTAPHAFLAAARARGRSLAMRLTYIWLNCCLKLACLMRNRWFIAA